jgi:GNAT superfamily N-acetyltransferase
MDRPDLGLRTLQDPAPTELPGFSCEDAADLRDFLVDDSLEYVARGLAQVYLGWRGADLVGFFSLSCGLVRYEEISRALRSTIGLDDMIGVRTAPTILLGRLAVDDRFRSQGIGTWLFDNAVSIAKFHVAPHAGCRFLLVDAKYERIDWYERKLGCRALGQTSTPPSTTRMGFDLLAPTLH